MSTTTSASIDAPEALKRPAFVRRSRVIGSLALIMSMLLAAWVTGRGFASEAMAALDARANIAATLRSAALRSELERYRTLPFVLAQDSEVRGVLERASPSAVEALDRKLEALAVETRAAVIYLVGGNGVTLAASNWRATTSFVGQDYGFRPYFNEALNDGYAELFALGTVSGEPGLYLARRVDAGQGVFGVVVVKVKFDAIEAEWARSDSRVLVTDQRGVVLITNTPEWRFRSLHPIPATEIPALRESRQYGADARLDLLPLRFDAGVVNGGEYVAAEASGAAEGWRLHLLAPATRTIGGAETTGRIIGALGAALVTGALLVLLSARRRAQREREREHGARRELEVRVAERTGELKAANTQLVREIDDRKRAETNLQLMQHELAQASKLAILGQITAGVAHEINQPLAAIRSYIDNAVSFMKRGELPNVEQNLSAVAGLTERIALITQELRAFSRKSGGAAAPVRVEDALDGALLLVSARTRALGVRIRRASSDKGLTVMADRARLEQVVVNLMQNALDAIGETKDPEIEIAVDAVDQDVRITIADNGPGLSSTVSDVLFTPFVTTKPQGLGLGLVISRDICAEYGGSIEHAQSAMAGAAFRVRMPRAP